MLIGIIKVILVLWIAKTIYGWYTRMALNKRRGNSPAQSVRPEPVHNGRIEDAEFEEMDGGNGQSR